MCIGKQSGTLGENDIGVPKDQKNPDRGYPRRHMWSANENSLATTAGPEQGKWPTAVRDFSLEAKKRAVVRSHGAPANARLS